MTGKGWGFLVIIDIYQQEDQFLPREDFSSVPHPPMPPHAFPTATHLYRFKYSNTVESNRPHRLLIPWKLLLQKEKVEVGGHDHRTWELFPNAATLYTTHLSILRLGSPIHGIRLFPRSMLRARSSSLNKPMVISQLCFPLPWTRCQGF